MTLTYRKAVTSEAKPLIGLHSESGGGKTHSALLLAKGFALDMGKVFMTETESGRGEAWADDPEVGGYNVIPIREEFSPRTYGQAISIAEKAGALVLIIDSASHEWEGVGGVLAMAAENQAKGMKGPLVWQKPKMDHAREFMLRLTQTPIPLVIVCMRSKYVMQQVDAKYVERWRAAGNTGTPPKVGDWARDTELSPKQSEDILFEMFVHGWLDKETHSFHGTKYTVAPMRQILEDGKPITANTGVRLAEWAKGRAPSGSAPPLVTGPAEKSLRGEAPAGEADSFITPDQCANLETLCNDNAISVANLKTAAGVQRLAQIKSVDYERAKGWVDKVIEKRKAGAT